MFLPSRTIFLLVSSPGERKKEKENKLSNELNRKKLALRGSISKHATIICYYLNIYSLFNPQNIAKLYPFSE